MNNNIVQVTVGDNVPRRGNTFSAWLGRMLLRIIGWRLTGVFPDVPKAVVIGAPHSSNWDGLVAAGTVLSLRVRIGLMAKDSLFRWPLGTVMRWLGGIPIDRRSSRGVVEQSVARFASSDQLFLGVAPEGTRTSAEQWKTGFHQIARRAGVPVLVVVLDYGRRELRFADILYPGDDMAADMARILAHYRGVSGRRPDRMSLPLKALSEAPQQEPLPRGFTSPTHQNESGRNGSREEDTGQ